jgi:hypothetical protein
MHSSLEATFTRPQLWICFLTFREVDSGECLLEDYNKGDPPTTLVCFERRKQGLLFVLEKNFHGLAQTRCQHRGRLARCCDLVQRLVPEVLKWQDTQRLQERRVPGTIMGQLPSTARHLQWLESCWLGLRVSTPSSCRYVQ